MGARPTLDLTGEAPSLDSNLGSPFVSPTETNAQPTTPPEMFGKTYGSRSVRSVRKRRSLLGQLSSSSAQRQLDRDSPAPAIAGTPPSPQRRRFRSWGSGPRAEAGGSGAAERPNRSDSAPPSVRKAVSFASLDELASATPTHSSTPGSSRSALALPSISLELESPAGCCSPRARRGFGSELPSPVPLGRMSSNSSSSSFNLGRMPRILRGFSSSSSSSYTIGGPFSSTSSAGSREGTPGRAQPPPLARRNSMQETKTIFARSDVRSASFCAAPGEDLGFNFENHFEWNGKLGSGSFADVWAVRHKTRPEERYAIKVLKKKFKSRAERAHFLQEAQLANTLPPHAHVVAYYRAWQESMIMHVQMELCERGTLREQMAAEALHLPAADSTVWRLLREVACGLAHIHEHGLIHCDVKPDNVLMDGSGRYKIGDLGQATALASWDEHEGDARYLSLDLLESNPSAAADVFSLGIMMYEVKSGAELPGHGPEWDALRGGARGAAGSNAGPAPLSGVDPALFNLIRAMMYRRAADRPHAAAVALCDPGPRSGEGAARRTVRRGVRRGAARPRPRGQRAA